MIVCFAIGYNVSGGAQSGLGLAFVFLGVAFAQLISFGALILLLTFWDAFFGTQISHKMLLKLFGKVQLKVIVASKQNDNLEFYLDPLTDKQNLDKLLEAAKAFQ